MGDDRKLPAKWVQSTEDHYSQCYGTFYCKGSILASALYQISQAAGQTPLNVATFVYQSLPKFRDDWITYGSDTDFGYQYLIKRIVEEAGASNKTIYCESFKVWFNELSEASIGCA